MIIFSANRDKERAVDVAVWGFAALLLLEQEKHLVAPCGG